jgi:hypothetical protein
VIGGVSGQRKGTIAPPRLLGRGEGREVVQRVWRRLGAAPPVKGATQHPPGQSGCPHSIPLARRLGGPRYRSASG